MTEEEKRKKEEEKKRKSIFGGSGLFGSEPTVKPVSTPGIDMALANVESLGGGNIYDKMASLYRQRALGGQLRTQKDIINLLQPSVTLWKEKNDRAMAQYQLELDQMDDVDLVNAYFKGPVIDEITDISKSVKDDMRAVNFLHKDDPEVLTYRKRIQEQQDLLVTFDAVNKRLTEIKAATDLNGSDPSTWSSRMPSGEKKMWQDIYLNKGDNIHVIEDPADGRRKLMWQESDDQGNLIGKPIDLSKIQDIPSQRENSVMMTSFNMRSTATTLNAQGASLDMIEAALESQYDNLDIQSQASLLFDGMDTKDPKEMNTTDFIESILTENVDGYSEMTQSEKEKQLNILIDEGMMGIYSDPYTDEVMLDEDENEVPKKRNLREIFKDYYLDKVMDEASAGGPPGYQLPNEIKKTQKEQQRQYEKAVEERTKQIKALSYTGEDYITNTKNIPSQIMSVTSATGNTSVPITTDAGAYIQGENPSQVAYNYTHPTSGQNVPTTKADYIWDFENERWVTTQYFDEDRGFEKGGGNGGGGSHFQPIGDQNLIKILNAEADGWGGHEARDKVFSAVGQMQEGNKIVIKMPTGKHAGKILTLTKLEGDNWMIPEISQESYFNKQELYSLIGIPNHFDIMQLGGTDDDKIIYAKKGSSTPYKSQAQKDKETVGHSGEAKRFFKHPKGTKQIELLLNKNGHPFNTKAFGPKYVYDYNTRTFKVKTTRATVSEVTSSDNPGGFKPWQSKF